MQEVFISGQTIPYELYKKKILSRKEKVRLYGFINIVLQIYPNYKRHNIEKIFSDIKQTGCTYSAYSNIIIEQLKNGKDTQQFLNEFESLFGYSLYDKENDFIDYNRLMVDLFSTLYNLSKLKAVYYDTYYFDSIVDAAKTLTNIKHFEDDSQAYLELNNAGFIPDGFGSDNKLKIKSKIPHIVKLVGTYQELANKIFGGSYDNLSEDEIKNLFKSNNIEVFEEDRQNFNKTSSLSDDNISFWINEVFTGDNPLEDINSAIEDNASICISSIRNSAIWMREINKKIFPWVKLDDFKAGHAMFFKGISDDGNLIVSSWAKDYLIPIEFYKNLEARSITVKYKQLNLENENNLPKY